MMFLTKVSEFNLKIKTQDLSKEESLESLKIEANNLIADFQLDFYSELKKRKILKKIDFLFSLVNREIVRLEDFEISKNKIKLLFKNDKKWISYKKKELNVLLENLFFINEKDDLYHLVYFYFLEQNNLIMINLYEHLS